MAEVWESLGAVLQKSPPLTPRLSIARKFVAILDRRIAFAESRLPLSWTFFTTTSPYSTSHDPARPTQGNTPVRVAQTVLTRADGGRRRD
jgi:hypothetical protein